jgi:hypothetical protein
MSEPVLVYVVVGQSNAVGGANTSDLSAQNQADYVPAYPDVQIAWEMECPTDFAGGVATEILQWSDLAPRDGGGGNSYLGIELSLGRRLVTRFGTGIRIIKCATSGTNLNNPWQPDFTNSLFEYMRIFITARMAELPAGSRIAGLIMVNGEGDAGNVTLARGYLGAAGWFLERFRMLFGAEIPLVISKLSTGVTLNFPTEVRDHQDRLAANGRNIAVVSTNDLALRDVQHYTADSFITLGTRIADAMPASYAGMGTTWERIRARQRSVLRDLVMTELPDRRLRAWDKNEPNFGEWAAASSGPFRVFEIAHGFDLEGEKYLDVGADLIEHTEEVFVSYPAVREFGGRHLDDLIDQDLTDIRKAIGKRGYAEYAALGTGLHDCRLVASTVENLGSARVLRIRFALAYDRSM